MFGFIKEFLSLPARVKALEGKSDCCCRASNKLELKSPDGNRMITLMADNHYAGIWITKEGTPAGAFLYHDNITGPCVGVRGDEDRGAHDLAIFVPKNDGASIQMIDKDKKIHQFNAHDLEG